MTVLRSGDQFGSLQNNWAGRGGEFVTCILIPNSIKSLKTLNAVG